MSMKKFDFHRRDNQVGDYHPEYENVPPDFQAHIKATVGQVLYQRVERWPVRAPRNRGDVVPVNVKLIFREHGVPCDLGGRIEYTVDGAYCYWRWVR